MGQIQQAINQMTSSALGAAVGIKAAQMAQAQKQEQQFNAAMKQAEMPVQQAQAKLEASEAERTVALDNWDKDMDKEIQDEIEQKVGEVVDAKGKISPKQRKKITDEAYRNWDPVHKAGVEDINYRYDEKKIELSQKVAKKTITAKNKQAKLIAERIKQLKGGIK